MTEIVNQIVSLLGTVQYNIIITSIVIILLIRSIYLDLKFKCLEKASEMVARVEGYEDLTGEQKFSLVITWINADFPKIFRTSMFQSIMKKLINYIYNNAFLYMKKYIKRKTGKDVVEILDIIKEYTENLEEEN